ncbi:MAG: hypothetical protein J07HX64_01721 [halophilic archaeon J07HX64]|nr:MAG: hypothetical protein J07HX64_01721 [halophilic archaeon J07HX64]
MWVTVVVVVVLGAGALGAAAVPFDGDTPGSAEVGDEVQVEELRLTEPFQVSDSGWTMRVSTELENPRLQVTALNSPGNTVGEKEFDVTNDTVSMAIDDSSINEIVLSVRGDVPAIAGPGPGAYDYENRDRENITVLEIEEVFEDQVETVENGTFELHRFTSDSRDARQAIDSASAAAEEADSDEARDRIQEAITFYDNAEFGNAITAANDAEGRADTGGGGPSTPLLVGAVLALVVVVGGVAYYLRSKQDSANKLQ